MIVDYSELLGEWDAINDPTISIYIEGRDSPLTDETVSDLLTDAPFSVRAEGHLRAVLNELSDLPQPLLNDIEALGSRFMRLMRVSGVRVRVEGITSNACRKMHADYTDVRLITTYAGPGTDYAPHGEGDCCVARVATGAVALLKGRNFGTGHAPCFHRSPPIEGSGIARLMLVIDTPFQDPMKA